MNPAFGFLVLLITGVIWLLTRPLWNGFGGWLYNRTDKITETLKEEHEVSKDIKGDNKDERNSECEKEN